MSQSTPPAGDRPGAQNDSRTRDELANERTFLAWLRTAVNVMIVGLAIAKFGTGNEVTATSLAAGGILVAAGAAGVAYGSARYHATGRDIDTGRSYSATRTRGPVIAGLVLTLTVGIALAILLAGENAG